MEFALPDNLKIQIAPYDPVLKKEVAARKRAASTRNKSTHPRGNVQNLIPTHIVSAEEQQQAVDYINRAAVDQRFTRFIKRVQVSEDVYEQKVYAILYHYEYLWVACWLPQTGEDYYFGFTYAFKDNAKGQTVAQDVNRLLGKEAEYEYKKFGRTEFRIVTHKVDGVAIGRGMTQHNIWNPKGVYRYCKKGNDIMQNCISLFDKALKDSIFRWEDSPNMWDRLNPKVNNYCSILGIVNPNLPANETTYDPAWKPTVQTFIDQQSKQHPTTERVWKTPFFSRLIRQEIEQVIQKFEDQTTKTRAETAAPWRRLCHVSEWIEVILRTWPDTPIDLFQNNLEGLLKTNLKIFCYYSSHYMEEWLRQHMKVTTFFHLLDKHVEKMKTAPQGSDVDALHRRHYNSTLGMITFDFRDLSDTFSMLARILHADKTIDPPRRWRIEEFHDHVQAEAWKTNNKNEAMPQDLFPQPIKVKDNDNLWTFLQPIDLHMLAEWGRAVRNCVGNASSYADGVKKKKHFIVLAMLNNQPRFTIQLSVRDGMMSVTQIVDVSNQSLTQDQKSEYSKMFALALQEQDKLLAPAAA